MKTRISVQERLKDLRVERGLNLEELADRKPAFQNQPSAAMKTTTTNTRKSITAAC